MNFIDAIKNAIWRTFDYKTRSSRSEYWWFILLFAIGFAVSMQVDKIYPMDGAANGVGLAGVGLNVFWIVMPILYVISLVVILSLSVRRFHDTDKSGWWTLIILVPFGFFIYLFMIGQKSMEGFNRFGEGPLGGGYDVFD